KRSRLALSLKGFGFRKLGNWSLELPTWYRFCSEKAHANHAVSRKTRVSCDSPLSSSWWKRKGLPLVCWNALRLRPGALLLLGFVFGRLEKAGRQSFCSELLGLLSALPSQPPPV